MQIEVGWDYSLRSLNFGPQANSFILPLSEGIVTLKDMTTQEAGCHSLANF